MAFYLWYNKIMKAMICSWSNTVLLVSSLKQAIALLIPLSESGRWANLYNCSYNILTGYNSMSLGRIYLGARGAMPPPPTDKRALRPTSQKLIPSACPLLWRKFDAWKCPWFVCPPLLSRSCYSTNLKYYWNRLPHAMPNWVVPQW